MAKQVLLVEDEPDVARLLDFNLRGAGFEVVAVARGGDALALARSRPAPFHVVVLDLMLPDTSGYDVCKALRADPGTADVGVLILTARGEAEDRILGLEVGADDYVVKPFVVREVVLRVTALAGRIAERRIARGGQPGPEAARLRTGPLEIDPQSHDVRVSGQLVQLRPLEYKLLALLVGAPGKVYSREDLLEEVWGMRAGINARTVDVHVRRLRVSLGTGADVVETVHGFGYRARRDG
jgi:two-component system, OmpR family, phosphate regulon response regulator PhoB